MYLLNKAYTGMVIKIQNTNQNTTEMETQQPKIIYDLIIEKLTDNLAIATGFNPNNWDAHTSLVEINKDSMIIKTLWEEVTGFSFTSEKEAHKQFLMDLIKDNEQKQTA
jgi:hypothetical protein